MENDFGRTNSKLIDIHETSQDEDCRSINNSDPYGSIKPMRIPRAEVEMVSNPTEESLGGLLLQNKLESTLNKSELDKTILDAKMEEIKDQELHSTVVDLEVDSVSFKRIRKQ